MPRILMVVLPLALMIYCLIDCAGDHRVERTSLPKALWMVLIVVLPVLGPVGWLIVSRATDVQETPASPEPPAPRPTPGPRPTPPRPQRASRAPDDDPDFLRRLDEERKRTHGHPEES